MAYIHIFSMITMITVVLWFAMRANKNRETYSFMICQGLLIIWSMGDLAQLQCRDTFNLYICYTLGNIGVCFIGSAWANFSCEYRATMRHRKFVKKLYAVSAFNYLMSATNPLHHLYYSEFSVEDVVHGPLFYLHVFITYTCMIFGIANLYRKTFGKGKKPRGQALFVAMTVLVPMALNVLYISRLIPYEFDPTPIGFTASSIFIMLAVYKYDFLDINTLTLIKISDNMSEGIIVCNINGEITYMNENAEKFFGKCENRNDINRMIDSFVISDVIKNNSESAESEVRIDDSILHIRRNDHSNKKGTVMAYSYVVSDVTKYYSLIEKTRQLAAANEEVAVEKERNRLAQEIHDTVGHTLTMVNSLSKIIKINYSSDLGEAEQYIDEISTVASSGITELRMAVNNISHCATSIKSGINTILGTVRDIKTEVFFQGDETEKYAFCSSAVCDSLRETITNCLRYSGADRIDVIVKFLDTSFELYVFDNGKGCDSFKEGRGITGIRNRIEEIGGNVTIASSEGNGFTTRINIPIGE